MELNLFKVGYMAQDVQSQNYLMTDENAGGGGGGGTDIYYLPKDTGGGGGGTITPDNNPPVYYPLDPVVDTTPVGIDPAPAPVPVDTQGTSIPVPTTTTQQQTTTQQTTQGSGPSYVESYGMFYDAHGNLISAYWQWYNVVTNEVYSEAQSTQFHVWGDTDLDHVALRAKAPGYSEIKIMAGDLQPQNDITFKKPPYLIYAAAVAALVLFATKRKKKVGKVTTQDVFPFLIIGGGLLAFSLVKKLLEGLGIWKSQDTRDLDTASTDPNSFWNPNYWRTIKPANEDWTYAITTDTASQWAADLYNAFGPFNDDEEQAIGVFKRCRTQANASFLCDVFQRIYNEDCLTFLRGGFWPQDRLSDTDVNTINQWVSRLPKY